MSTISLSVSCEIIDSYHLVVDKMNVDWVVQSHSVNNVPVLSGPDHWVFRMTFVEVSTSVNRSRKSKGLNLVTAISD